MLEIKVYGSGSAGNCYEIVSGDSRILLECGLRWKEICKHLNFKSSGIDGVLISHEHGDHACSAKDAADAGLELYASKGTFEKINLCGHHRSNIITSKKTFNVGEFTILPFDTIHDCAEPLGFLIVVGDERLLFITDSAYCRYRFNGITHLMCEANFCDDILADVAEHDMIHHSLMKRVKRSHFSIQKVCDFISVLDKSKMRAIWLIHLSDKHSDAKMFKRKVQEITGLPVIVC